MSNYTITEGTNTLTLTLKNNTKYGKTIYNNTAYYNNTTDKMLQAKKNGTWNCFSLLTLDQVIIPKSTSFNTNNKINLIFKDTKGLTSTITIPLLFDDFEEELRKQFNPTFNNNMGYMYGFIKTVLFDIYQDSNVLKKISTYDPDTVTLTIATADTETLPNASVTVTAKDSDNTAIASLPLTILVGETSSTGTTDSNGQYNFTLTTEDCFLVVVTSGETEQYHTATKTIAISTKKPCPECPDTPGAPVVITTSKGDITPKIEYATFTGMNYSGGAYTDVATTVYHSYYDSEGVAISQNTLESDYLMKKYSALTTEDKEGEYIAIKEVIVANEKLECSLVSKVFPEAWMAKTETSPQDEAIKNYMIAGYAPVGWPIGVTIVYGNNGTETEYTVTTMPLTDDESETEE